MCSPAFWWKQTRKLRRSQKSPVTITMAFDFKSKACKKLGLVSPVRL
jgi:hypothetical protein